MKFKKRYIIIFIILLLFCFIINDNNINKNNEIIILDMNDNEICLINNNHITNSINDIDDKFKNIIITIEDETFYSHNGFDIYGILSAIKSNIFNKTSIGASTITQQYIKNTYLTNNKNIFRKLKEIYLAIRLENKLSKDEILCKYLSCIYFGNNVYGLTNASQYYFSKDYHNLVSNEMIALVTLFNSPSTYSSNIDKWNDKIIINARKLYNKNIISYDEYNECLSGVKLNYNKKFINSNRLFYIDSTIDEFNSLGYNSKFNETITIKTMYNKNSELISSNINTNYGIISVNKEGYINSLIGNNNYYESTFNIVKYGNRDIGSTIKPLLYYEALKCNIDTKAFSKPYTFNYNDEKITITNNNCYYKNDYIDMYEALAISDNTYAVRIHLSLGIRTLKNHLKMYGIDSNVTPMLALGNVGMSLYDLCKIYTQFFSSNYKKIRIIKSIKYNNKIKKYNVSSINYLDSNIVSRIDELLKAPFDEKIKHSTCSFLNKSLKCSVKGKSGLTDYDSYMIGYNENNLVCVWAGDVDNSLLVDSNIKKLPKYLFRDIINIL